MFIDTSISRVRRSALALACLFAVAPQAGALGFGDLAVGSSLGEPLAASIRLLGDDAEQAQVACFSVIDRIPGGDSDLPTIGQVALSLGKSEPDGQPVLLLHSRSTVHEPLTRLVVRAACGGDFRREYVVMLSPRDYEERSEIARLAPEAIPETADGTPGTGSGSGTAGHSDGAGTGAETAQPATQAAEPPATKARSRPARKHHRPARDRVVVKTPVALSVAESAAAPLAPRIDLSGGGSGRGGRELESIRQKLADQESQREKELQTLQSLEVHVISLQKQVEDLQQQIRHKDELEQRLQAQRTVLGIPLLASENDQGSLPAGVFWMLLVVAGVGGLSAAGTYTVLKRSQGARN